MVGRGALDPQLNGSCSSGAAVQNGPGVRQKGSQKASGLGAGRAGGQGMLARASSVGVEPLRAIAPLVRFLRTLNLVVPTTPLLVPGRSRPRSWRVGEQSRRTLQGVPRGPGSARRSAGQRGRAGLGAGGWSGGGGPSGGAIRWRDASAWQRGALVVGHLAEGPGRSVIQKLARGSPEPCIGIEGGP